MYTVVKRDGKQVDFDISKIKDAIIKAFDACGRQYHPDIIDFLVLKVTSEFEPKIEDNKITVEAIQDSVESVLIKAAVNPGGKLILSGILAAENDEVKECFASRCKRAKSIESAVMGEWSSLVIEMEK